MMTSIRCVQCSLLSLLLICIVQGERAYEFCEDGSKAIENGYVQCTVNGRLNYPAASCQIECLPGYVAYPRARMTCSSRGSRVLKIDSNGQTSYVSPGRWNGNVTTAECRAPTSCTRLTNPKHGSNTCSSKGDTRICLRTCQYPYEVSEPIHQREHCGPKTNFFWSHVIRHNSSEVPPCVFPQKCRALQDTDFPEHGQMMCNYEAWADTTICKLDCERGYVPKDNNKKEVFCGPATAFIWSHVHVQRNSYAQIEGCKQSPITTEVTMAVEKPCEGISTSVKEQDAQNLNLYLRSKVLHLDSNSKFSLTSWKTYCEDKVIQRVVNDNVIDPVREGPKDQNMVQLNPFGSQQSVDLLHSTVDVILSNSLVTQIDPVSPTINPTPASKEDIDQTGTVNNVNIVNVTISELTYSLHYKALCTTGQCKEACRVLNMTQYQLCLDICLSKVKAFQNSQENQAELLQTLHVGKLMTEVYFPTDVSTAYSTINGTKFKSLNVTTISMKTNNVTERQAIQMREQNVDFFGQRSYQDRC